MSNIPTPHIGLDDKDDIAKVVLMPGDPLRAKFLAENYLDNVICFNKVRNVFGYTGYYKGKKVSVMASGMGMPSIGIYSYELFKFYDVDTIIRIGSCGAYNANFSVYDLVLAKSAYSESTFADVAFGYKDELLEPSIELNDLIKNKAKELNIKIKEGIIHSSDVFYHEGDEYLKNVCDTHKCDVVEMESFALFANAKNLGKKAACLLTVSDSFVTHEVTTSAEREKNFTKMMELALEVSIE